MIVRVVPFDVHRAGQRCDRHRGFTLTVYLHQLRAKQVQCLQAVFGIHRSTAIDDCLQVRRVCRSETGGVDQAGNHRGREKERGTFPDPEQGKDFVGIEPAGCRDNLAGTAFDMGQHIKAGSVAVGSRVDDAILRCDVVDIGEIGVVHCPQVLVRQHSTLGATGCAGRIEKPGEVVRRHVGDCGRGCR